MIKHKMVGAVCPDLLGAVCSDLVGAISSGQVGAVSLKFPIGNARRELESRTEKKVVSKENYLPEEKKTKQLNKGKKK